MPPRGIKRKAVKNADNSIPAKKVAVVKPHVEITEETGTILVMGQGDVGQLGLGEDITERKKPAIVRGVVMDKKFVKVVCGGMHTLGLTSDGAVYSWGCNDEGAIGRVTTEDEEEYIPKQIVDLPADVRVIDIAAGDSHSAALTSDGDVFGWGTYRDINGSVGLCPDGNKSGPVMILSGKKDQVVKVHSGNDHTVALTASGKIFSWGCADQGQLGRVKECFTARGGRRGLDYILKPGQVRFRRSAPFSDIFCGSFSTFAIAKQTKDVYTWGLNNYGQLGTGDVENYYNPVKAAPLTELNNNSKQIQIASGQHHSLALASGKVFAFGRAEYGRLGLGEEAAETSEPTLISSLETNEVAQIACGDAVSFAVTSDGKLFAWGLGSSHQLGLGEDKDSLVPTLVEGKNLQPNEQKVLCVDAGGQHAACIITDRT